jgi:hypothetical protein
MARHRRVERAAHLTGPHEKGHALPGSGRHQGRAGAFTIYRLKRGLAGRGCKRGASLGLQGGARQHPSNVGFGVVPRLSPQADARALVLSRGRNSSHTGGMAVWREVKQTIPSHCGRADPIGGPGQAATTHMESMHDVSWYG